ncbi:heavy-metal-associated domain-containing protein [Nocardioides coralli]|uniref:heavy-metal-associated domain-containing protein n=1 Tax=Nocardioides coralli TaxID=2872154 RepID=UPI001CA3C035|nr:cation transporter [Nocardioides coralli]QZY27742.1 cation transporter [Nocardioides coralli]
MPQSQTYTVTGMTCGHCVASVTEEVGEIACVSEVSVVLETGEVTVSSDQGVADDSVRAAVEEADYQLA